MINNATQLKAKVRNVSNGNDNIAKSYIRIFFMERFMERLSLSKYKDNFVIKGGMLVSSLLGIDLRSTMDIDTSVYSLTLSIDDCKGARWCSFFMYQNLDIGVGSIEV